MAINTKKISGLSEISQITGDEYILVTKNNRSYKAKAGLFTSDKISSITQTEAIGDDAISNIDITISNGDKYTFSVKNGSQGSPGKDGNKGAKGEDGNTGVIIYDKDPFDLIIDTLDGTTNNGVQISDSELSSYILSARQGSILNGKLKALEEEYLTQEEYDAKVKDGKILDHVKYFILEEETE